MSSSSPTSSRAPGVPEPIPRERAPMPPSSRLPVGHRLGRYRVETRLGSGGMGVVYAAQDPRVGRRVAVKVVQGQPRSLQRLVREAHALARLSHPNIVHLYDVGTTDDGMFMAMEFVRGESLRRHLRGDHAWETIIDTFAQAGKGLAAAHEAGIMHRDFKPSNVIVGYDGRVRVLDFGLALGTPGSDQTRSEEDYDGTYDECSSLTRRLTDTNVILGTTAYMAPEQLLGGEIGIWSDQFSFCVALFEALYGTRPFSGRNPVEIAIGFHDPGLIPPADRRGVPRAIHRALLRGLSIEPGRRFRSMHALLEALRPAKPDKATWRPATKWAIAVCGLALTALTTVAVDRALRADPAAGATCDTQPTPGAREATMIPGDATVRPRPVVPAADPGDRRGGGGLLR